MLKICLHLWPHFRLTSAHTELLTSFDMLATKFSMEKVLEGQIFCLLYTLKPFDIEYQIWHNNLSREEEFWGQNGFHTTTP